VLELSVELIRAVAWPAIAIVGALVFYQPLSDVARHMAAKVQDASKVSIGAFSLEVAAKAREPGNPPELASQVGALSSKAVEQLLRTPRDGAVVVASAMSRKEGESLLGIPEPKVLEALQELERAQFLEFAPPLSMFLDKLRSFRSEGRIAGTARDWYDVPVATNQAAYLELRSARYSLTPKGRAASDAIVKAVAAQLPNRGG